MKKLHLLVMLCIPLLFLSSCLTVYEKYTLNRDGSGAMEYIIDMSELHSMMQAFSDSSGEGTNPLEIDQSFREILPGLKDIPGITNVRLTGDADDYIYGIKYDFGDQDALNHAMAVILGSSDTTGIRYVEIKKKRFIRYSLTSDEITGNDLFAGQDSSTNSLAQKILDEMFYNISVTFPKRVKKVESMAETTQDKDKYCHRQGNIQPDPE